MATDADPAPAATGGNTQASSAALAASEAKPSPAKMQPYFGAAAGPPAGPPAGPAPGVMQIGDPMSPNTALQRQQGAFNMQQANMQANMQQMAGQVQPGQLQLGQWQQQQAVMQQQQGMMQYALQQVGRTGSALGGLARMRVRCEIGTHHHAHAPRTHTGCGTHAFKFTCTGSHPAATWVPRYICNAMRHMPWRCPQTPPHPSPSSPLFHTCSA
jgi:hypothetical protein